jgi:hypothetical protein
MNTISALERDIARLEAYATYHEGRAVHCRKEAALLKSELRQEQSDASPTLEELRELAQRILTLSGLTGPRLRLRRRSLPLIVFWTPSLEGYDASPQIIRFTVGGFASNRQLARTETFTGVLCYFRRPNGIIRSVDVIDDNVLIAAKT